MIYPESQRKALLDKAPAELVDLIWKGLGGEEA
jgi:hypothetical protein